MVRRTAYGVLVALVLAAPGAAATAATTGPSLPEPVQLGGSPVEGGTAQDPTTLTAGLWADTLTGPGAAEGNARWFRYQRTMQFSSVLVGVVATSAVVPDSVAVAVFAPDGSDCGTADGDAPTQVLGAVFGAQVVAPHDKLGNTDDACVKADHLDIKVTRGTSSEEGDEPFALRLVEEGPLGGSVDDLPAVLDEPTVPPPSPSSDPISLAGGTSFDDAPLLTPGATVSDAVPEGAEHLFRVHLGWGQALAVRVDVPEQDAGAAAVLDYVSPYVDLRILDPRRVPLDSADPDAEEDGAYGDEALELTDSTLPVNPANRIASVGGAMSVPGDYWVSVSVATPTDDRTTVDVPIELTVDVSASDDVAPTFRGKVVSADGNEDGPAGYDPATPFLVGADRFSADVSGTSGAPDASDGDVRRTAGLAVGGTSLLALLAGLLLLRRRSRVSRPAAR